MTKQQAPKHAATFKDKRHTLARHSLSLPPFLSSLLRKRTAGDTGVLIVLDAGVQDGIGDLVADLVCRKGERVKRVGKKVRGRREAQASGHDVQAMTTGSRSRPDKRRRKESGNTS